MSVTTVSIIFLIVIVPVVLAMLGWTIWTVVKICQPSSIARDEWDLLHSQVGEEPELESSLVGVREIQNGRRAASGLLDHDYSYRAGQNMGYGIPVSWIQDLGDRKN